jgi:hypothetical protein
MMSSRRFPDIDRRQLLNAGGIGVLPRAGRAAALLAIAVLCAGALAGLSATTASAQAAPSARTDAMAVRATSKVTFGYVVTGDSTADEASRRGLVGLGKELTNRTTVEPGEPFAVNIETDEIAFFPVLYWPVLPNAQPLSAAVLAKIDAYMKQGGMIIFDTKDYGQGMPSGYNLRGDGTTPLQRMLGSLDIPRLEPVPEHHVLTKSFYLLRTFPGRYEGGSLWVEAETPHDSDQGRQARRVDGVSSILITANDLAGQSTPWFPAASGSANTPSASASTSSCTCSPATTRATWCTCRRFWSGWGNDAEVSLSAAQLQPLPPLQQRGETAGMRGRAHSGHSVCGCGCYAHAPLEPLVRPTPRQPA